MKIIPIAHFKSPFSSKFGIPKQSGMVSELKGQIIFTPPYRNVDYIRGLEHFDYLWLIWEFSANTHSSNSPLVRPPLLGGNETKGIFATRSPFRPNPLGLSSVKIDKIELSSTIGPVIHVLGGDLMNDTPIYDIKPYIEYADSHTNIRNGFVDHHSVRQLKVDFPLSLRKYFSQEQYKAIIGTLSFDPRPRYQCDKTRRYGMPMFGYDIRFLVDDEHLTIVDVVKI